MIVTDLNRRERERHAEMMAALLDCLAECRNFILAEKDEEMRGAFVITMLMSKALRKELMPVITAAINVDIPDSGPNS